MRIHGTSIAQSVRARRSGVDRHVCNVKATGSNPVESIHFSGRCYSGPTGHAGIEGQSPRVGTGSNPVESIHFSGRCYSGPTGHAGIEGQSPRVGVFFEDD
jgi:hypothetical protein